MALITRPDSINKEEYSQMVIEDGKVIMIVNRMRERACCGLFQEREPTARK